MYIRNYISTHVNRYVNIEKVKKMKGSLSLFKIDGMNCADLDIVNFTANRNYERFVSHQKKKIEENKRKRKRKCSEQR